MRTFLSALPLIGCVAMTLGCARMMGRRSSTTPHAAPQELELLNDGVGARSHETELDDPRAPTASPR